MSAGEEPPSHPSIEESGEAARLEATPLVEPAAELAASGVFDRRQLRAVLPHVLVDVPVALLLVERHRQEVLYANEAAIALTGPVGVPIGLAEWGRLSELTDVKGDDLVGSLLSRVLETAPDGGEPVRSRAGDGLGDLLWATGIPLSAVTPTPGRSEGDDLALLLFLRVRAPLGSDGDPEAVLTALRNRAVIATDLAFTISDPALPDNPLQWVNPAFTRMTGYTPEEVLGRNCRFLQGPDTDPAPVTAIRSAIAERRAAVEILLNYRKDGTPFWNQLSVSPVFDADGTLLSYVGVQYDVSERVRADHERTEALESERAARLETEAARRRLALTAEVTAELSATLDVAAGLERLADLVVPTVADWVAINIYGANPADSRLVLRHRGGMEDELAAYARLQPAAMRDNPVMDKVLGGGEAVLVPSMDADELRARLGDELTEVVLRLGIGSAIYVPLVARQHVVVGSMVLVCRSSTPCYDEEDLAMAADIGRRAGVNLDNARLYEQEHRVAEILQRSLLPELLPMEGVSVAATYMPANSANDVGGDFYEVLALPDGAVGLAVGDVVGHDMSAAAAMGHLRGLLRACAWDLVDGASPAPAAVVDRVDRLVQGLSVVPLATAVYLRAEREGAGWRIAWSNAGHPWPLLRLPDGSVRQLDDGGGVLLGVGGGGGRVDATTWVPTGATVVLYTDGLVERRGEPLDAGIARAADLLAGGPADDLEGLVACVLSDLDGSHDDDVAVVALRFD